MIVEAAKFDFSDFQLLASITYYAQRKADHYMVLMEFVKRGLFVVASEDNVNRIVFERTELGTKIFNQFSSQLEEHFNSELKKAGETGEECPVGFLNTSKHFSTCRIALPAKYVVNVGDKVLAYRAGPAEQYYECEIMEGSIFQIMSRYNADYIWYNCKITGEI
jgi:hypothetical protein